MKLKILVVESNDLVRIMLIEALNNHYGHYATAAESIKEGEVLLTNRPFDLVICDNHFVIKRSGVEFLEKVSRAQPTAHRVLMSSGENPGWHGGEFLSKPFNLNRLKTILENASQTVPQ